MKYSPHQELKNQTIDMPDLRLETRVKMIDMRNLQIEVKTNRLKSRQLNRQQKMKLNLRFLQQRDQFQDPDLPQGRHSVRLLQEEQLRVLIQETRDKSSQESDPRLHRVISQHRRHRPLPMTGPTIRNCKNNNIISKSWIIRNRSVFMIIKNLNFYNLKFVSFSLNEYILREKKYYLNSFEIFIKKNSLRLKIYLPLGERSSTTGRRTSTTRDSTRTRRQSR